LESKNENPKATIAEFPQALPRIDLKDKVTGQAQYIEDLPDRCAGYGAIAQSILEAGEEYKIV
jgi:hypothetical protein